MVVLVRCLDNTFAPALESGLDDLVAKGQIAAFLHNGSWIEVARKQDDDFDTTTSKRIAPRLGSMMAYL